MLAAVLAVAWALAYPHTPDLAAQDYRQYLFDHFGLQVWDGNWYGGHHLLGYSLLIGPFGVLLGLRLTGVLAVLASTLLFERLARRAFPQGATAATAVFALAAAGDLWIGRITFALGVAFALAAALAAARGRHAATTALAVLAAAASPVAGAFLALAGAAHVIATRRASPGLQLAAPAALTVLAAALLFPEGGRQPFPATTLAATLAAALAFAALTLKRRGPIATGAVLYVAAVIAAKLIPSPMGSNVGRMGILLAAPLLVALALHEHSARSLSRRRRAAFALALSGLLVWIAWGPVREVAKASGDPSTQAAYYAPLNGFLAAHLAGARVEVPFTRAHWESDFVARQFPLARGWERQLDLRYDSLFFHGTLTPAAYAAWLRALAVRYVALPDAPLDSSSRAEARIVRSQPPFLRLAWTGPHWRVYRVLGAAPAASGAATVTALTHEGFDVRAAGPGTIDVQVRWSRYFTVTHGRATLGRAPGGWTRLTAARPGPIVVRAGL